MRIAFHPVLTQVAFVTGALIFLYSPAIAHEPGMSTAVMTMDGSEAVVVLTFSKEEVAAMADTLKTGSAERAGELAKRAMTLGGLSPATARTEFSGDRDIVYTLTFTKVPQGDLNIEAPLLVSLVPGHRQYLIVRDSRKFLLLRCFLTPTDSMVTVKSDSSRSG